MAQPGIATISHLPHERYLAPKKIQGSSSNMAPSSFALFSLHSSYGYKQFSSKGFTPRVCWCPSLHASPYCILSQHSKVKKSSFIQAFTSNGEEFCNGSTKVKEKYPGLKHRVAFRCCDAAKFGGSSRRNVAVCRTKLDSEERAIEAGLGFQEQELPEGWRKLLQVMLWTMLAIYVVWLFLAPTAPGDPVWAIKPGTVSMIAYLSLNFFFILPLCNAAGINFMMAPVLHPTAEALFNMVMGWTLMFAPLIFTDRKRNQFRGSLEALWLGQMFLTNIFLIPYMAIRISKSISEEQMPSQFTAASQEHGIVYTTMTSGAQIVGLVGGLVGVLSVLWAIAGRFGEDFGSLTDRASFFVNYICSDRLAYAFVWDIGLYSLFQPWLIGDNIENVDERKQSAVKILRFVPYCGLVAYLWGLSRRSQKSLI
ncbi:hypothetical protein O6H91_Y465300 [Diphasiastrum complanatum]|nr:hypothetical protein O6H91_Y465300 [Diphasiastrum complanatum]